MSAIVKNKSQTPALDPNEESVEPIELEPLHIRDRSAPRWALVLGGLFSITTFFCLVSIAVLSIFFQTLVIGRGEQILAPILMMVGTVPMLGIIILEFAHNRTLAGYRQIRSLNAKKNKAVAAVLVLFALTFLHPLAGAGILAGTLSGGIILWILSRLKRKEPMWDFVAEEAASILSGRDARGLEIASQSSHEHAMTNAVQIAMTGIAVLSALSVSSWLASKDVLAPNAVMAITLLTLWSTDPILAYIRHFLKVRPSLGPTDAHVTAVSTPLDDEDMDGLQVNNLSVFEQGGKVLLSELNLKLSPGSITGIIGDSGSGKTLLFQAIIDPFSLSGLQVRGRVSINGHDLWRRLGQRHNPQAVYLAPLPILLPATGHENLSCFHGGPVLEQGKRILEKMVFSSELAEEICSVNNANTLPGMQKKMLALSRAFLLSPNLYLFDRPEDSLPEKQISALISYLKKEVKLGRTVVVATENRALIEACDTLVVMQEGRIIDKGNSKDVGKRQAAGWARFVGERKLNIDENLESWIRSHFKRPGDEHNRRKVSHVASEMLLYSCQSQNAFLQQSIIFEFKHYDGYCELSFQDSDAPIGSVQLSKAQDVIDSSDGNNRLTPLASIISNSLSFEASAEMERRRLLVKIETTDPRKKQHLHRGKSTDAPYK